MIDREQIINALEHCVNDRCKGCPYQQKGRLLFGAISCDEVINENTVQVPISLINRVLTLLKAREPGEMTLEEAHAKLEKYGIPRYHLYSYAVGGDKRR